MIIRKEETNGLLILAPDGRLDTNSSPELEAEIEASCIGISELMLDFGKLRYLSSAGMRVLLSAQQKANAEGFKMSLQNVNDEIMEVFEMTGFSDFLNII